MRNINKGFSLMEIIISLAILGILFSFIFYFISTITLKNKITNAKPYMLKDYNYSNKYCHMDDILSISQTIDMSAYISTSSPITSMHIFNKNRMIITTNSASTSEKDVFLFNFNIVSDQIELSLLQSLDIGPGINDALLHDNFFYMLDTSINSHVRTIKINQDNNSLSAISIVKINELHTSGALPKKIYLYDKRLLIGTEKNNAGGEMYVLPLDQHNMPTLPSVSIEIGGQVSGIYENQGNIFVANASDTELFVYDTDFSLLYSYDAPLSLGNGKSVYYLEPFTYLGRTVASFEIFLLEIKNSAMQYLNKFKGYGSIDFIQSIGQRLLFISSAEHKELQLYDKEMNLLQNVDLPERVNSYNCFNEGFLFSIFINNQSNILWLK